MKVNELIKLLKTLKPDEKIYLSSDAEGNNILAVAELVDLEIDEKTSVPVIYPSHSDRIDF